MSIPLDGDGYIRRECPNCERQFKWRVSDEDESVVVVDQYYCPLCGQPAGLDSWWTREQIAHAQAAIIPEALREVQSALKDAFRGSRSIRFEASHDAPDIQVPEALHEPDDMEIVQPLCHPGEPVKVPEDAVPPYYCLVCGEPFAV